MVGEGAGPSLRKSTAAVFLQHQNSPEQLTLVYEHLVREAQKIAPLQKQKARSPMRLVGAFCQAVNFKPNLDEGRILGPLNEAAPPMYAWRSPEGPPDQMALHFSTSYLRGRMQLLQGLAENWWGTGDWNPFDQLPAKRTFGQLLERWEVPLLGAQRPDLRAALLQSQNTNPNDVATDPKRACRLVGLLACTPSFQTEVALPTLSAWLSASGRAASMSSKKGGA
jgi:hypothetical protein